MSESIWLAGPEAKLDRAIEHLETLDHACERFIKTQPYTVTTEFEADAGCYVARFQVRRNLPVSVSVIVGELVHNLRSALEHVAWVLATCNADDPGKLWEPGTRERITFPVAKTQEAFDSHSLLPFISREARTAIDRLQPHTRGQIFRASEHPLVALHELWNIDKHRVVHGGIGEIDLSTTSWVPKGLLIEELEGGIEVEHFKVEGPLKDGAPIAHVRFPSVENPPGTTQVDMKGQPTARILFGAGGKAVSGQGLEALCVYVALVLSAVRPVFPMA